ncbi:MFS general substrate transporter [Rhizoclosmatium globosum]|uniref:MFS general substrate transporter n=1 Tax=Rhizoclosmatium globosum TaxID=329046 RepID=A0A1Y2BVL6_9FUNG|nr:MFS general substrate transporter [Rhizoclosmatium globosum]|eukprot:ORY38799.1 MFS general substrate transporter [Rhizoclosmatium globosum]
MEIWLPISDTLKRYLILWLSVFCMVGAGSVFAFSVLASQLQTQFNYSSGDLNVVSGVGFAALYLPFLFIGPFYDIAGPQWTLVLAIITYSGGYLLLWGAYVERISASVFAVSVYYFFVGIGSTAAYMAVIGVNVGNFAPKSAGTVTGFLHFFYAVAGSIYSGVYRSFTNVPGYIIFLATSVGVTAFASIFILFQVPIKDEAKTVPNENENKTARSLIDEIGSSEKVVENGFQSDENVMSATSVTKAAATQLPNYLEMPALIHSDQNSLTSIQKTIRRKDTKLPRNTLVAPLPPLPPLNEIDTTTDQFTHTKAKKNRKSSHLVQIQIDTPIIDERRQVKSKRESMDTNLTSNRQSIATGSKRESVNCLSDKSLPWVYNDIKSPPRASKVRGSDEKTLSIDIGTLKLKPTVWVRDMKRTQSIRPHMPGGYNAEILRTIATIKSRNTQKNKEVGNESEETLGSQESMGSNEHELTSAWDILKSPVFWFYACTCIFQQGTVYMTNVGTILMSAYGGIGGKTGADIDSMTLMHVMYMSMFQASGMFGFGVLSDFLESLKIVWLDRTVLMVISQIVLLFPVVALSTSDTSASTLLFCSICTGLGFGGSNCLLPVLTQDFFGLHFFGTAVGFAMTGVPVGILICNSVFGVLNDQQMRTQGSAIACYGAACYQKSFQIFTGIQVVAVATSLGLLILRLRQRYAHLEEHKQSLSSLPIAE